MVKYQQYTREEALQEREVGVDTSKESRGTISVSKETQVREDKGSNKTQRSFDLDDDDLPFSQGIRNAPVLVLSEIPKYDRR